jgi:hypothetical protein
VVDFVVFGGGGDNEDMLFHVTESQGKRQKSIVDTNYFA